MVVFVRYVVDRLLDHRTADGEALFQTHDNVEHLKMMEHALRRNSFPRT